MKRNKCMKQGDSHFGKGVCLLVMKFLYFRVCWNIDQFQQKCWWFVFFFNCLKKSFEGWKHFSGNFFSYFSKHRKNKFQKQKNVLKSSELFICILFSRHPLKRAYLQKTHFSEVLKWKTNFRIFLHQTSFVISF